MQGTTTLPGEDLLQPVLTERDDPVGFHHPWSPWTLLVIGAFLGPWSAGILYGWNFRRLGDSWRSVTTCGVGFTAAGFADAWARVALDRSAEPLAYRLLTTGLTILVALVAIRFQHRRHALFVVCDGESKGLFRAVVVAFVGGFLPALAVGMALSWMLHGTLVPPTGP